MSTATATLRWSLTRISRRRPTRRPQAVAQPSTVVVKFGAQLASTTRKPCDAVGRAHVEQTEWTLRKVWSGGVAVEASNNMAMKLGKGVKDVDEV